MPERDETKVILLAPADGPAEETWIREQLAKAPRLSDRQLRAIALVWNNPAGNGR